MLPAEIAGFLLAVESANRERNQAIVSELKAAVALLNGVGIQPVLLKGLAYLKAGVYEDLGHRYLNGYRPAGSGGATGGCDRDTGSEWVGGGQA